VGSAGVVVLDEASNLGLQRSGASGGTLFGEEALHGLVARWCAREPRYCSLLRGARASGSRWEARSGVRSARSEYSTTRFTSAASLRRSVAARSNRMPNTWW
jgi:hypothetical protein